MEELAVPGRECCILVRYAFVPVGIGRPEHRRLVVRHKHVVVIRDLDDDLSAHTIGDDDRSDSVRRRRSLQCRDGVDERLLLTGGQILGVLPYGEGRRIVIDQRHGQHTSEADDGDANDAEQYSPRVPAVEIHLRRDPSVGWLSAPGKQFGHIAL